MCMTEVLWYSLVVLAAVTKQLTSGTTIQNATKMSEMYLKATSRPFLNLYQNEPLRAMLRALACATTSVIMPPPFPWSYGSRCE